MMAVADDVARARDRDDRPSTPSRRPETRMSSTVAVDLLCDLHAVLFADHFVGLADDAREATSGPSARAAATFTISFVFAKPTNGIAGRRFAAHHARGDVRRPRVRSRSSRASRPPTAPARTWLRLEREHRHLRAAATTCAMLGNAGAVRLPGSWQIASTCAAASASAASPTSVGEFAAHRLQLHAGRRAPTFCITSSCATMFTSAGT